MKTILLKTCDSAFEAHLIKGKLENEKIASFIAGEHFATLMPHYHQLLQSGVQIFIHKNDLERAKAIISEEAQKLICPNCGSTSISFGLGKGKMAIWLGIFLSLIMAIPFGNLRNLYICKDCKTEFKQNLA